ncbi:exonuclease domain-containing protein [Anaerobacillus sp. CMMVII]|uniref:3'-5' exonuclease n=1 Tax=Anaerobacillus sp. CMMVII TaxID=2755588 RepID=UPI0021B7AEC2|nr:3'-5' exonuclease [Anaerobacillus sp. CMMVII]MCT8138774.1 exonuclease domain-containing protein [Anaerobacillus sp. CMMVII]
MNAIVFDLELIKRFRKGQLSEIVEIGACKVSLNEKKIIDQFQIYITPKSGYVSKSTRKFIKMTKEDLKNAVTFHQGIHQFANWLGDDYFLCAWGKDDKAHIINQCVRNKINLDWFKNYNDIQKQIGELLVVDNNSQIGLKNALNIAGIEPVGKAHRGIDDAINTAHLLLKFIDTLKFNKNNVTNKEISQQFIKNKQTIQQNKIYQASVSKQ